jgi:hypothetical protein
MSRLTDSFVAVAYSLFCVAPKPGSMSVGIIRTKLSEAANRTVVPYGVPVSAIVQIWPIAAHISHGIKGPVHGCKHSAGPASAVMQRQKHMVWFAYATTCWHAAACCDGHSRHCSGVLVRLSGPLAWVMLLLWHEVVQRQHRGISLLVCRLSPTCALHCPRLQTTRASYRPHPVASTWCALLRRNVLECGLKPHNVLTCGALNILPLVRQHPSRLSSGLR